MRGALAGRVTVLGGLLAAVLVLMGALSVSGTSALLTDRATATGGALTSASMAVPALPVVSQVTGTGATRLTWSSSSVGSNGATATTYEVQRYATASGGAATLVCVVTVGPGTDLACQDGSRPAGTQHYAVRARFGGDWRAESGRRAFAADLGGPEVVVTEPADGYRGNAAGLRRETTRGCGSDVPGCGTATDGAGVVQVRWVLELVPSTGNRALRCWTGTAYVVAGTAGCPERDATTSTITGGLRWFLPGTADGAFRGRGAYTLTVTAVDAFGNITTASTAATVT